MMGDEEQYVKEGYRKACEVDNVLFDGYMA